MFKKLLKATMLAVCMAAIPGTFCTNAEAKPKNLSKNVKVGDIVYFGKYEQDGKKGNGKEKLAWRVLDKKGGKALVVTEKLIEPQPYHKENKDITWEKSDIRKWLNKDFVKSAFSASENKKLSNTKVVNKDNPACNTDGGKDTTDKVFLLSIDEAKKYFKSDDDRRAKFTEYYKAKFKQVVIKEFGCSEERANDGIRDIEEEYDSCFCYWLRSPGELQVHAAFVGYDGSVDERGDDVYHDGILVGVRPALWVNL